MKFTEDVEAMAAALRTDPTRTGSVADAAVKCRVQATSDLGKAIVVLLIGLGLVAFAIQVNLGYLVMPLFCLVAGAGMLDRGRRMHRHARVIEAALTEVGAIEGAPASSSTLGVLPKAPWEVPRPATWQEPEPERQTLLPPNVWSA